MPSTTAYSLFISVSILALVLAFLLRDPDYSLLNGCGYYRQKGFILRSSRIVTPAGIVNGSVSIREGIIQEIYSGRDDSLQISSGVKIVEYGDLVLAPGVVDGHVHFSEPGFDEKEGVKKGTRAAAAGGITTVVDYPMTCSPLAIDCQKLKSKIFRFLEDAYVNIAPLGGIVPENVENYETLKCMMDTGMFGFHSILSEDKSNLTPVNLTQIESILPFLKKQGYPYLIQSQSGTHPWTPENELEVVKAIINLLQEQSDGQSFPGFKLHFTSIMSPMTFTLIKSARDAGLPVSCEVTGPSLHFASRGDDNLLLKTYPLLGSESNRLELIESVLRDEVDFIVSDHAPATPEEKFTSYAEALPGISGIQYLLPSVWTSLKNSNSDLVLLFQLLSTRPAELFRIDQKTGSIKKGLAADIVVWDPESLADTSLKHSFSEHPMISPYLHSWLYGTVHHTWVRGNLVYSKERGHSWRSCPKIYGLGEWAKIVILWFYEVSFNRA